MCHLVKSGCAPAKEYRIFSATVAVDRKDNRKN